MENTEYKIGDKIFHISNPSINWVIEKIEDNEVYCSALLKDTLELKKEKFTITSIKKYESPKITFGSVKKRNNHW